MIQIEINRFTLMKLEEAITKYNKESPYHLHDYVDMINKALELYLKMKVGRIKDKEVYKNLGRSAKIELKKDLDNLKKYEKGLWKWIKKKQGH